MASPVGHTLSGLTLKMLCQSNNKEKVFFSRETAAAIVIANLPDVDLIPGILTGDSSRWHHQFTHSFFFAVMVSVCIMAAAVLVRRAEGNVVRPALLGGGLIVMHLALDLFTADPQPPVGLQVLWPFSSAYFIAPWSPLERVLRGGFNPHMLLIWLKIALKEAVIFGPPMLGSLYWRKYIGKEHEENEP